MDKQKAIEEMAQAIRYVDLGGHECLNEYIEGSNKLAEAALNALIEYLPEARHNEADGGMEKMAKDIEVRLIYQQLKGWKYNG
jgi:hypothetical protein